MTSVDRLPVLDYLRAASILLVLATHGLPIGPKSWELNAMAGPMGMSLFFVLSGFLITRQLMRDPDVFSFLVRRIARIVPLAFAYSFVVYVVILHNPTRMFWTDTFALNYISGHTDAYNSHFWSLCVEMQFYLAIAAAVVWGGPQALRLVWPACCIITVLKINNGNYFSDFTHIRADDILVGACIATVYSPDWSKYKRVARMAVVPSIVLLILASSVYSGHVGAIRPYATAVLLASLLVLFDQPAVDGKLHRILTYIAAISYALYVIHIAFMSGWFEDDNKLVKYLVKRPIAFAFTVALAHLSTFTWEAWWQDAGRAAIARRKHALIASGHHAV